MISNESQDSIRYVCSKRSRISVLSSSYDLQNVILKDTCLFVIAWVVDEGGENFPQQRPLSPWIIFFGLPIYPKALLCHQNTEAHYFSPKCIIVPSYNADIVLHNWGERYHVPMIEHRVNCIIIILVLRCYSTMVRLLLYFPHK